MNNLRDGLLSVIIPAYNENINVTNAALTVSGVLEQAGIEYEIIFIDDGSSDDTWSCIENTGNTRIKGLKFSRNFGKEAALFAGMTYASGDAAAFIDCDLQHPPELLPEMYRAWSEGYDVIEAVKSDRGKERAVYKFFASLFYRIMEGAKVDIKGGSDYKLIDRKPLDELLSMPERLTFFRALSSWVGYSKIKIPFEVQERQHGATKWNYPKLFKYAVNNFTSYTGFPLHIITAMGFVFMVFAAIMGGIALVQYFRGTAVGGFTTVILLLLIIGAFLMIGLGIIGVYIEKIYEEIKARPRFIIDRTTENVTRGKSSKG